MGSNIDDIPWPRKRPKKTKKTGSSGKSKGTVVGMSVAIFGSAIVTMLVVATYVVWGHLA